MYKGKTKAEFKHAVLKTLRDLVAQIEADKVEPMHISQTNAAEKFLMGSHYEMRPNGNFTVEINLRRRQRVA